MKNIISQNQKFEKYELSIDEAINKFNKKDEYRTENIEKIKVQ
jgi:threonyl-tRNA synthetase